MATVNSSFTEMLFTDETIAVPLPNVNGHRSEICQHAYNERSSQAETAGYERNDTSEGEGQSCNK